MEEEEEEEERQRSGPAGRPPPGAPRPGRLPLSFSPSPQSGGEMAAGGGQAIVWRNVVLMGLLHLGAVYALSLVPRAQLLTLLWGEWGGGGGRGRGRAAAAPLWALRQLL